MINDPLIRVLGTEIISTGTGWVWITRLFNIYVVIASIIFIFIGFNAQWPCRQGKSIWFTVLIYTCGPFMASFFGERPGLYFEIFLFPLTVSAIFLTQKVDVEFLARNIKSIILIFIYGSIIAIVVNPLWSMQFPYYSGVFPIPVRLFGLAESPQRLGPLLLLYMVVERLFPTRHWIKYLNWIVWGLALILAQGKVAIVSAPLFVMLFMIDSIRAHLRKQSWLVLSGGLAVLVICGLVISLLAGDPALFNKISQHGRDIGVDTMTGRTEIWNVTISAWIDNPLFGYGPRLWDLAFRTKAGPNFMHVGMAHNQYIQTLGEAGLFGFVCLFSALYLMAHRAIRLINSSKWVSMAIFLILLFPTATEAPFRNYFLGEDFFTLLCVCALLIHLPNKPSGVGPHCYD